MNIYFTGVIDVIGVTIVLIISLLVLRDVRGVISKIRGDPLTFRYWLLIYFIALAFITFAVARSVGHVVKFILVNTGYAHIWKMLAPFSGSINTVTFIIVAVMLIIFAKIRFEEVSE